MTPGSEKEDRETRTAEHKIHRLGLAEHPTAEPGPDELTRVRTSYEGAAEERRAEQGDQGKRQSVPPGQPDARDDAGTVAAELQRVRVLDHDALHESQVLAGPSFLLNDVHRPQTRTAGRVRAAPCGA